MKFFKWTATSVIAVIFGCSVFAQDKKPDISFKETTHQFKDVEEGQLAITNFGFKNTGTAPLTLKNVKASCGCTSPSWPRDSIMPGDSGNIKVAFNSSGYANRTFAKSVTVTTNIQENGQDKMAFLYINGNVIPKQYPLRFSEPSHDFGNLKKGKSVQWTVNLINDGDSAVFIKTVTPSCPCIVVGNTTAPLAPHQSLTLNITFNSKSVEPKDVQDNFKILTNIFDQTTRLITSTGYMITGKVTGKPSN
jgi:hypothetical protein